MTPPRAPVRFALIGAGNADGGFGVPHPLAVYPKRGLAQRRRRVAGDGERRDDLVRDGDLGSVALVRVLDGEDPTGNLLKVLVDVDFGIGLPE